MSRARNKSKAEIEAVFEEWYADEERDLGKVADRLGIKFNTIQDWHTRYKWAERAKARDEKARAIADKKASNERAKAIERHARLARKLQRKGSKRLNSGIIEEGTAVRAIVEGVKMERTAMGLPAHILEIMGMTDDELSKSIEDTFRQ